MKTIKVTIPGTESTWCVKATGEECVSVSSGHNIHTMTPGKPLTTMITTERRHSVYCRREDLEETPGYPPTTREFKVPDPSDSGTYCALTNRKMECKDAHHCPDCIYQYLVALGADR